MSKIVEPQNKPKKRQKKSLKIILVLCLIIFISIVICFFVFKNSVLQNPTNKYKKDPQQLYSETDIASAASEVALGGDYDSAQKIFDDALDDSSIKTEDEAYLYLEKALLAYNNNKIEDALTYAKKAEEAEGSRTTSRLVAQVAEKNGDKELAIEYYELTISRYSEDEKKSILAQDYDHDLQSLEELKK